MLARNSKKLQYDFNKVTKLDHIDNLKTMVDQPHFMCEILFRTKISNLQLMLSIARTLS